MPPSPLNTKSPDHPPTGVAGDAVPDLPSCWQLLSLFPSLRRCFRREEGTVGGDRDDSDPGDRREFLGATAQAEPQGAGGPGGARRRRLLSGGKAGGAPVPRASLREDSYTPVGALARERGEKRHAPSRRAAFKFVVWPQQLSWERLRLSKKGMLETPGITSPSNLLPQLPAPSDVLAIPPDLAGLPSLWLAVQGGFGGSSGWICECLGEDGVFCQSVTCVVSVWVWVI